MTVDDDHGEGVPWWLWPNLLSLDAPVVAVLWQGLFAVVAGVTLPIEVVLLLGLAVWVIYVVDRLGDAVRLDERFPATRRHRFYREWERVFRVVVVVAGLVGLLGAGYWIPGGMAVRGAFLALMVGGYFCHVSLARRVGWILVPKEALCGFLFAVGSNLAPAYYIGRPGGDMMSAAAVLAEGLVGVGEAIGSLLLVAFAILCTMNCALISHWERGEDAVQDRAAVTHWRNGRGMAPTAAFALLAGAGVFLAATLWDRVEGACFLCIALSAAGHWVLDKHGGHLSNDARRVLADVMLLTPMFVLPFL